MKSTLDIIGNIIAMILVCVAMYIFRDWHADLMEKIGLKLKRNNKKTKS